MEISPDIVTQGTVPIDAMSTDGIKDAVNAEYEGKPHGGSKTPWIIGGLAVALIIVFLIVMIAFFVIGNNPQTHEIAVVNNCRQPINVLVGTEEKEGASGEYLGPVRINPGGVSYFYATPSVYLVVKGYYDDTDLGTARLTKALIWFNDNTYNGPAQISGDNNIINVSRTAVNGNQDNYGISMKEGFNMKIGIISTNFNNKNPADKFSCLGPTWYYDINENICPQELQFLNSSFTEYAGCMSACSAFHSDPDGPIYCCSEQGDCGMPGGCQNNWPNDKYYTVFNDACPNCMVTNCDGPAYYCGSSGGLSQYIITFCPTL